MKSNCGCKVPCGCGDVVLTTPPSCNTNNCSNGDPCPETFAANCAIYTGDTIANLDILKGDRVSDIIQKLALLIVNPGCAYPTSPCQAPVGFYSTTINSTNISLKWGIVSTATSYQIEYRVTTSGTWLLNPIVTGTTDTIGSLIANTAYYVRVKAICSSGSCYSLTLLINTTP